MRMEWRRLCNSFQWISSLFVKWKGILLVASKYLSKPRHKVLIICHSTLLPLTLLPDVWTKTNSAGANAGRAPRKAHRGPVYIEQPAVFSVLVPAVQPVPPCPRPVGSTGPPDMARLALSVILVLYFSLPHLSSSRPSRTRKAVSPRQPGGNKEKWT